MASEPQRTSSAGGKGLYCAGSPWCDNPCTIQHAASPCSRQEACERAGVPGHRGFANISPMQRPRCRLQPFRASVYRSTVLLAHSNPAHPYRCRRFDCPLTAAGGRRGLVCRGGSRVGAGCAQGRCSSNRYQDFTENTVLTGINDRDISRYQRFWRTFGPELLPWGVFSRGI